MRRASSPKPRGNGEEEGEAEGEAVAWGEAEGTGTGGGALMPTDADVDALVADGIAFDSPPPIPSTGIISFVSMVTLGGVVMECDESVEKLE